tara:strand:+ start:127 stop:648 length:522 start_codon:yes stop_codon:yes gene_type:complete
MSVDTYRPDDVVGLQQDMNKRIFSRNFPSESLEPRFFMHSIDTKRQLFPTTDSTYGKNNNIDSLQYNVFDKERVFVPPTNATGPWSGYASNIDIETQLQHRMFAYQKHCEQAHYIPSNNSHLYKSEEPYKAVIHTKLLHSKKPTEFDENIVQNTKTLWHNQSRLDFHSKYDRY